MRIIKNLGWEDKPREGSNAKVCSFAIAYGNLYDRGSGFFPSVFLSLSYFCQEIRYRAARLRSRACLMCIDPKKERARLFSADSYIMRLHPLDKHYDWFACLHNAPDYRLPWKHTKLGDLMGQRKFNTVNV